MKTRIFITLCVCACSAILSIESHAQKQQVGKVEHTKMVFGPKPDGLTNLPTIGQPAFIVPGNLLRSLGGAEITNLVVSSIGNLLINSERFKLTYAEHPQYECRITLSDLQIHQVGKGTKAGTGEGFPDWVKRFVPKSNLSDKATKVDWSKDEVQMSVRCGVSMQIVDSNTKILFAGDDGEVNKMDTTRNINMELAGLTFGRGETHVVTSNTVSFQSRLILLASYYALTNMLPRLDAKLLKLPASSFEGTKARVREEEKGAPVPSKRTGSAAERLKQLKELLDQKLITEADYEKKKQEILDSAF